MQKILSEIANAIDSICPQCSADVQSRMEKLCRISLSLDSSLLGRMKSTALAWSISAFLPRITGKAAECQQSIKFISSFDDTASHILIDSVLLFTTDPSDNRTVVEPCQVNIISKDTAKISCPPGGKSERIFEISQHRMPAALCIGCDPLIRFAAESDAIPPLFNPLSIAGFLRGEAILLKPCITQKVTIPAKAEIVIEGYIQKSDGIFHISCTTHGKNS